MPGGGGGGGGGGHRSPRPIVPVYIHIGPKHNVIDLMTTLGTALSSAPLYAVM